ncbi:MAG TPA: glycerol kinase GlpK [Candidatus Thermoplasmatota archaeon]|nr:glycerol kinase GlpK [Candidatus Thermoplasmatota archaeon]
MPHVLALDAGTTGVASLLFDERGRVVAHADRDFEQRYPRPGWVEHDPELIWATAQRVMRAALKGGPKPAALGITNQRETVVAWDGKTGRPLAPAIVWQDRRTAPMVEAVREAGHEAFVRERTGLVLDAYFSATKMRWLLEHVPRLERHVKAGTLRFGTIDTWLIHLLTNGEVFATDATNACRTQLFDIHNLAWDAELGEVFGVPLDTLPEVRPSSGDFGFVAAGLPGAGLPIRGVAGDQQAALFGQACYAPGEAKTTYGTGAFLLMNTGTAPVASDRLVTSVAWSLPGRTEYCLEGSIFTTGAAVQWLRDVGLVAAPAESEALARAVRDTGGVTFVPALAGLGAPHWDPHARGAFLGLTRGTTRAHLARAVLESTAFSVKDVLDAMQEASGHVLPRLRVDGGGSMNKWLMQFQADTLGVPVERPVVSETTALGAAYLAGLASGVWKDTAEIAARWKRGAAFSPRGRPELADALARWARALPRAAAWDESADPL